MKKNIKKKGKYGNAQQAFKRDVDNALNLTTPCKYELTDETMKFDGVVLHRIRALVDVCDDVHKGDLGGWIECEENLCNDLWTKSWVYDEAKVYNGAHVNWCAKVRGNAIVRNNSIIGDSVTVCDSAIIDNFSVLNEFATVYGNAMIKHCDLDKKVKIGGDTELSNLCYIRHGSILGQSDMMMFHNTWSSKRKFFYIRSCKTWTVGCFYGTGKELIRKAFHDSFNIGWNYMATVLYVRSVEEKNRNFLEKIFYKFLEKTNQLKFDIL